MERNYGPIFDAAILNLAKVGGKWTKTKLSSKFKENGLVSGEPITPKYAMDRVIDILVDGGEDFVNEWNKVTGYAELNTHHTPIILVNNERLKELANLIPMNPEFVHGSASDWCLSWVNCTYSSKHDSIKLLGDIPTLFIVKDVKLLLKRIISDSVDPKLYEIMNISDTGKITAIQAFFDQTTFWNVLVNWFKRRGMMESFTKKLLKLKYIKKIKK